MAIIVTICTVVPCVLAPLALFDSQRFWWATRAMTALVFLAFSIGSVYQLFFSKRRFEMIGSDGEASPNALVGLLVFGMPALWYTIFGRLTLRRPTDDKKER